MMVMKGIMMMVMMKVVMMVRMMLNSGMNSMMTMETKTKEKCIPVRQRSVLMLNEDVREAIPREKCSFF